uniref:Reverse transcriptase n=1 Tax=Leptobrachium leishanense TaxID=445787 RepID=A0A8C5PN48_9ANUR
MEPTNLADTLNALTQQLAALAQTVQDVRDAQGVLQNNQNRLEQAVHINPVQLGVMPEPPPYRAEPIYAPDIHTSPPETYDGNRHQFRSFITSCQVLFSLQPHVYNNDFTRVRMVISLLRGKPQTWAHHLLHTNNPILNEWNTFFGAMEELYDDHHRASNAAHALMSLRQGRSEVEDYITEFRHLALESDWNEPALLTHFRLGLPEALKDERARTGTPNSLEDTMRLCIRIDRRLRERRAERTVVSTPQRRSAPPAPLPFPALPSPESEPMQVGEARGRLDERERNRRRSLGLCMYCGRAGHQLRECRLKPQNLTGKPMTPVKCFTNYCILGTSGEHLTVNISLQWQDHTADLTALIDSGASQNFIDISLIQRLKIQFRKKSYPFSVSLLDGTLISSGLVTQETEIITMNTGVRHREEIIFDIVKTPIFLVILGIEWLRLHNPSIDWIKATLTYSSAHCKTKCIHPQKLILNNSMIPILPQAYTDFYDVFEKKGADTLPPHRPYECPIDVIPGATIPFGRVYPLSEPELRVLREYIDENLTKGFIRPSTSPAGAAIFFVGKKDGGLRPCIDYRAMNAITIKNKYPLPLITELMDRLKTAKIFTKLDLRGAYNLVRIKKGDEWKTAFRSRYGHYEYLVMPYGLCNAPATFQYFLNDILKNILDQYVIVYLDDILIYSDNQEDHTRHVRNVLLRLRQHRLYAKLEKCRFNVTTLEFLGFVREPNNIRMDPSKIEAIRSWPTPANKKGIQCFIGFCNFYRKFIKDFSKIIKPLTYLTKQSIPFKWSVAANDAFCYLKHLFSTAPILSMPDTMKPFILETDASDTALGAILSQVQGENRNLHPIAFYSRTLTPAEINYDVGDKELLAIKAALEEWRHLLEGTIHPITIYTDHKNLEYLRQAKRLKPRQARWALFFSRFVFNITYRPGKRNGKADALSRSTESRQKSEISYVLPRNCFLNATLSLWDIIRKYSKLKRPDDSTTTKKWIVLQREEDIRSP